MRLAEEFIAPEGEELSKALYRKAQLALELWDFNRVCRAFDGWERCKQTFYGRSLRWAATHRSQQAKWGHPLARVDARQAIADWQAACPGESLAREYNAFRVRMNATLAGQPGAPFYPAARTLASKYSWPELLNSAWRKLKWKAPAKPARAAAPAWLEECHLRPWLLVGSGAIDAHAGRAGRSVRADRNFPVAAVRFDHRQFWLARDVDAYFRGEVVPKRELYELSHLYLDAHGVAPLVAIDKGNVSSRVQRPPEYGEASRCFYWLKAEVEAWVAENHKLIERRLARQQRRRQLRERTLSGFEEMLVGATTLRNEHGLYLDTPDSPQPALFFPGRKSQRWYLWSDIEAHMRGEALPSREANFLRGEVCTIEELGEMVNLKRRTLLCSRERYCLPRSLGHLGARELWAPEVAKAWAISLNEQRRVAGLGQSKGPAATADGDE
jgi:hypothetical protein